MYCKNCDHFIIDVVKRTDKNGDDYIAPTTHCAYWLQKSKSGYRNALWRPKYHDVSCTQFMSYKCAQAVPDIPIGMAAELSEVVRYGKVNDFIHKGYSFESTGGRWYIINHG